MTIRRSILFSIDLPGGSGHPAEVGEPYLAVSLTPEWGARRIGSQLAQSAGGDLHSPGFSIAIVIETCPPQNISIAIISLP